MSHPSFSLSSFLRATALAAATLGASAAMADTGTPCTGGPAVYDGSRSAVLADLALWQRSGMADLALLAQYAPDDPAVLQARHEYEQLRNGDAYPQEVSRIAAARGETLSGFSGSTGCGPAR